MKITVFGTGYVGLVTGACLAEAGNHVLCMDVDQQKIDKLQQGIIPIYEPGLEILVKANQANGMLRFTSDAKAATQHGLCQFIAVGTPPCKDGSVDLRHVFAVAQSIAQNIDGYRVIINKSTVPVGTADEVKQRIQDTLNTQGKVLEFDLVSNPEFLKEGAAVTDFMKPDRIVIGTDSQQATKLLTTLYAPFNKNHERIICMDARSAELTKYAANAMLATKISFINELANLAEKLGADIENVRRGIGADNRIGYHFIYPGCGYGGSCFPKDVKALAGIAQEQGYEAELLVAVEHVNNRQKHVIFNKIRAHYQGNIKGKTFALWGLAFKPKTDDMREAPSRTLIKSLLEAGAKIKAYDPKARAEAERIYADTPNITFCDAQYTATEAADALCIVTEWKNFWSPNFQTLKNTLKDAVIFDGRNVYNPEQVKQAGLCYYSIGRAQ